MFRKLFGQKDGSSGSFYRPYKSDAVNQIYNLLFCDDPKLLSREDKSGPLGIVLSEAPDRDSLQKIGNDVNVESRTRALAFNRLREMKLSVPSKRLLGTIIEFPQAQGLDTLAVFTDQRLRYINHTEKLAIFESSPSALVGKVEEVLRASQFVVNRYGPWDKPRRPPPAGKLVRMTFLVSDGLYFGEGLYPDLMRDRFAAPVIGTAGELLPILVDEALKIDRGPA